MKIAWVLPFAFLACTKPDAALDAAPSATVSEIPTASVPVTRGAWWAVAAKSRVYTEERRVDADNAIRMLQSPTRETVLHALDDMAKQNADADGLRAASQAARDAQDKVDPDAKRATAKAGFIVLGGLVATASTDHGDVTSLKRVLAAVREMPLPHLEKSDGRPERLVLEQEMRTVVDDKTMKTVLAGAPAPKKSD
ncbi:MAG TPA: hypothetical protein VGH28_04140 [Polyangiaceae bacterium]|jgi:hypothetical protein